MIFSAVSAAATPSYGLIDLGTLGGTSSFAYGINSTDEVVGSADIGGGVQEAFLYTTSGGMVSLGLLTGGTTSVASGINNAGQITGTSDVTGGQDHAFYYNGTMHDLSVLSGGTFSQGQAINNSGLAVGFSQMTGGLLQSVSSSNGGALTNLNITLTGGNQSEAMGVNASGQVVGEATNSSGQFVAFSKSGATTTNIGTLGGVSSEALGVNSSGEVVGFADTATSSHAFSWTSGAPVDLGVLGTGKFSQANGVNDSGEIVGTSATIASGKISHAFLDIGGVMIDLNTLLDPAAQAEGWTVTSATGINNNGDIVGYATNGLTTHAVLLEVVPEPTTVLEVIFGLGLLGLMALRKRQQA